MRLSYPIRRLPYLLFLLVFLLPALPAQAAPPAPIQIAPVSGSTTTVVNYPPTGTPTLEWQPVSGARKYNVEVCTSSACSTVPQETDTYNTRWVPPQALADGTWYWHVRAQGTDGQWGPFSSAWSFEKSWLANGTLAPVLLSPDPSATVEFYEDPIFSWTPVDGAAFYRFRIFNTGGCGGTPMYEVQTLKPRHTPTRRDTRGDYYWQVAPVDHRQHEGSPSECRAFHMDYFQTPTLLFPDDYAHETFTPEFRWTAVKGAKEYRLQVSTVPDFSSTVLDQKTPNTRYTPVENLENDKEYYWRVCARDLEDDESPWTTHRTFYMEWHLVPRLLSPTFSYISSAAPLFRWTPVAGAKIYRIQVDDENSFSPPLQWEATVAEARYQHWGNWRSIVVGADYYWRVRAEDNQGYDAPWSDTWSFRWSWTYAPPLVYPPYYYDPTTEPSTGPLDVYYDPIIPVPVFMWDRVVQQYEEDVAADSYRIQVDDDFNFYSVNWTADTENLSIAPTVENGFALPSGLYYWRTQAYRGGVPISAWSEAWPFLFDDSTQVFTTALSLYFPSDGWNNVHNSPLFGWSPVQGAARYHFEIYTSTVALEPVDEAHPIYSLYTPQDRLPPETYYWRVQAEDSSGSPIGSWSQFRRVVVASQVRRGDSLRYPLSHPIRDESATTRVGQDPAGDAGFGYDLTNLYLAVDRTYWYLNLDLPITNTLDTYYVFYVDLDQDQGATFDRMGFGVTAAAPYEPEVAFYAHHTTDGEIDSIFMTRWLGTAWGPDQPLESIGGSWMYRRGQYLELQIPVTALNLGQDWLGVAEVEAFVAPNSSGALAQDTVPSESSDPTNSLTNFTAASDRINPVWPWDNTASNPVVFHNNPALMFTRPLPLGWNSAYHIQVARDRYFTTILRDEIVKNKTDADSYYWHLGTLWSWVNTFEENETLFWRVALGHDAPSNLNYGPWSQPMRITKSNYVPLTLQEAYTYTTPTFSWDRVEGVSVYTIQIDDDPEFGSVNLSKDTDNTSYTPIIVLADRSAWYWRVRVRDGSNQPSNLFTVRTFSKESPAPALTSPVGGIEISELPTFKWEPVLGPSPDPMMNSIKYYFVVDNDPNFSSPDIWHTYLDTISVTTLKGTRLLDGPYYWKVCLVDSSNSNPGPYSVVGTFTKQYPTVTMLSQDSNPTPDLRWAPQDGAAYYEVQVCRDQYYGDCIDTKQTDGTRYVATGEYIIGDYYWRVRLCDFEGACGPYYFGTIGPAEQVFLPVVFRGSH